MVERKTIKPPAEDKPSSSRGVRRERVRAAAGAAAYREEDEEEYAERRGRGRPPTYKPEFARQAGPACALGATDAILATMFGVTTTTIQNWLVEYPEFKEAVAFGKAQVFDPLVERSLAQRALGYSVDTEEIKVTKDGKVLRVPVRKHYPPDVTACIFWLKNRQPEKWRDVWKLETEDLTKFRALTSVELLDLIRKEATDLGILPANLKELMASAMREKESRPPEKRLDS